jgi:hypothetical protein
MPQTHLEHADTDGDAVLIDPRMLFGFRLSVNEDTPLSPQSGLKMGDKNGNKLFGGNAGNAGIRKKRI